MACYFMCYVPVHVFSFRVFVLIHKMDLVPEENRERIFHNRKQVINDASAGTHCTFFMTSIWDETLYKVRCVALRYNSLELVVACRSC